LFSESADVRVVGVESGCHHHDGPPGASRASAAADLPEGRRGSLSEMRPLPLARGEAAELSGLFEAAAPPALAGALRRGRHGAPQDAEGAGKAGMRARLQHRLDARATLTPESPGTPAKTRSLRPDHGARAVTGSERTKSRASDAPIRLAGITQSAGSSLDGPVPRARCDDRP
jgi:hypothetical protein